ncbi:hypothetical protein [Niabella terrae]
MNKIASAIARIKYPGVPPEYFYFYRDTIVCKMIQSRYNFRDYLIKRPYKILDYEGEFANELQFALPHAYWHHQNGSLLRTRSLAGTRQFYYFSEDHQESFANRSNAGNYNFELPRILYSQDYRINKWLPPPLKQQYKNAVYHYNKPLLVIANRYNMEWDGPPVSFLSIELLDILIRQLKPHYQIIYNRPGASDIVNDNSEIYDLGEFDWLRSTHPEVLLMGDLFKENKISANNFNHFQMTIYANCNFFISTHGGTATLASYFKGTNLILSKKGPEHYFGCFTHLYPQLSGARIHHASGEKQLLELVSANFLK